VRNKLGWTRIAFFPEMAQIEMIKTIREQYGEQIVERCRATPLFNLKGYGAPPSNIAVPPQIETHPGVMRRSIFALAGDGRHWSNSGAASIRVLAS
jgi:hypothetical protein